MAMREILPGVHHWTAFRETIGRDVSSYHVLGEPSTLIDPMEPEEGLGWFEQHGSFGQIVLTNRLHYRDSARFVEALGCQVRCHRAGLHAFGPDRPVQEIEFGEQLASAITAHQVGALTPEETALHIRAGDGALALGDSLVRAEDGSLAFFDDSLLGDDPEEVKSGLRAAFRGLLELDFDHLLFAHAEPWIGGARAALREFAGAP